MSKPRQPIGLWGWSLRIAAFGYPIALLLVIVAFRLIGERWWVTAVALYLPRVGFALPLPFLTLALCLTRPRRLLVSQLVAAVLLVFPIMGLSTRVTGRNAPSPGGFRLRVMSYNVDGDAYGAAAILGQIHDANPDLILLQEVGHDGAEAFKAGLRGYSFESQGQFIVASRYPVSDLYVPPKLPHLGRMRTARFLRYRLSTPAGDIQVYNLHPVSPRDALDELHGDGLRSEILSGRIFGGAGADEVRANTDLRVAQIEAVAGDAGRASGPVIICGDTNLPHLSWALGRWLGVFHDGFEEVGTGFGYTFPAPKRAWMRIDRILTNDRLRFLGFTVPKQVTSDHLPVIADLELLPAR